jgi:RimJ/RimL family protein N-acetyltransferase
VVSGPVTTRLRRARPDEVPVLEQWDRAPASEFADFAGDPPPGVADVAVLPLPPGSGTLAVVDGSDALLGSVCWRPVPYGPNAGSQALDVGIGLHPSVWGRGHGSRAQRMLADLLFATTPVHRVQASTDVRNAPERRALSRAGFTAEGLLRGAQWRRGAWHDLALYARLRTDP